MPRATVTIPAGLLPVERVAFLLAVLVYPDDERACQRFADALVHQYLADRARRDLDWAKTPQVPARYLRLDPKRVAKEYKKGVKLLFAERLLAGSMLVPFLLRQLSGSDKFTVRDEHGDAWPLRLDHVAEWAAREQAKARAKLRGKSAPASDSDTGGKVFEQRPWRHTKPVLHLATVLAAVIEREQLGGDRSIGDLLESETLVVEVVFLAEGMRLRLPEIAAANHWTGLGESDTIAVVLAK